jgi:hypothetical protein
MPTPWEKGFRGLNRMPREETRHDPDHSTGRTNCGRECNQSPIPPQFLPAADATTHYFTMSYASLDCGGESVTNPNVTQIRTGKRTRRVTLPYRTRPKYPRRLSVPSRARPDRTSRRHAINTSHGTLFSVSAISAKAISDVYGNCS